MHSSIQAADKRKRVTPDKLVSILPKADALNHLYSASAEEAVLGTVLYEPTAYHVLSDLLQPSDFYELWHGYVWWCFNELERKGQPIDLLTVGELMTAQGWADDLRLASLGSAAPRLENVETYARLVKDHATVRRILLATQDMRNLALVPGTVGAVDMLIDQCNQVLFEATEQRTQVYDAHISGAVNAVIDDLEARMDKRVNTGFSLRWQKMDTRLSSIQPGELAILAGYAGAGKTTFMLDIILNALLDGEGIALFSLEMTAEEVVQALIAKLSGVSKSTLKNGVLSLEQHGKMLEAASIINKYPLYIYDKSKYPALTPLQFRRTMRALMTRESIGVAFIDGLWLMEPTTQTSAEERRRDVHYITRDLIEVGTDLKLPICLMHQYRSEYADRQMTRSTRGKHPTLRDLSESASVQRNAHIIIGLHRPSQFNTGMDNSTYAYIMKNRNASFVDPSPIEFRFNRDHSQYREV